MKNEQGLAKFLKVLADEIRLQIIKLLSHGELCVCELQEELDMSQPRISHHLRILKKNELVNTDRDGKWIYYSLNQNLFELLEITTEELLGLQKNLSQATPSERCRKN
ncbi:ArsR/SmtB family transcription factor [Selenihalanaerobacter shriftii]|uniref:ArsR family transcriptional regulator n=1 Tax=Selenihalanaerobacter shriftii TaxID=142842 RepID=A0A1T4NGD8_9FIRM|nr:metalloregulator ArsR/SmtB family transcription factor [Selenihalanaerobacter shriftii]SJZ78340.1 ArsR family transcriptional regulator [Selenihalanaerobacter shriftii]